MTTSRSELLFAFPCEDHCLPLASYLVSHPDLSFRAFPSLASFLRQGMEVSLTKAGSSLFALFFPFFSPVTLCASFLSFFLFSPSTIRRLLLSDHFRYPPKLFFLPPTSHSTSIPSSVDSFHVSPRAGLLRGNALAAFPRASSLLRDTLAAFSSNASDGLVPQSGFRIVDFL